MKNQKNHQKNKKKNKTIKSKKETWKNQTKISKKLFFQKKIPKQSKNQLEASKGRRGTAETAQQIDFFLLKKMLQEIVQQLRPNRNKMLSTRVKKKKRKNKEKWTPCFRRLTCNYIFKDYNSKSICNKTPIFFFDHNQPRFNKIFRFY